MLNWSEPVSPFLSLPLYLHVADLDEVATGKQMTKDSDGLLTSIYIILLYIILIYLICFAALNVSYYRLFVLWKIFFYQLMTGFQQQLWLLWMALQIQTCTSLPIQTKILNIHKWCIVGESSVADSEWLLSKCCCLLNSLANLPRSHWNTCRLCERPGLWRPSLTVLPLSVDVAAEQQQLAFFYFPMHQQ